jgi:hypothetical protein
VLFKVVCPIQPCPVCVHRRKKRLFACQSPAQGEPINDETNNCLEIVLNLIYLARHSLEDPQAVDRYLAAAEEQALRLAKIEPTASE